MNGNQQPEPGFQGKQAATFKLLYFLVDMHATALTPFIRTGFGINANGVNGLGAMILLLFWSAADAHDPLMSGYFACWLGALLIQKAYTLKLLRQGNKIHSRYWGDPWLALKIPFVRKESTARAIEPTMCFVIGLAFCPVSQALGALWMIGFITLSIREAVDRLAANARMQHMDDAEIEAHYYSRLRQERDQDS
jgi:hypothetical protein